MERRRFLLALAAALAGASVGRGTSGGVVPRPATTAPPLTAAAAGAVEVPPPAGPLQPPTGVVQGHPTVVMWTVTLADVWAAPAQRLRGSLASGSAAVG